MHVEILCCCCRTVCWLVPSRYSKFLAVTNSVNFEKRYGEKHPSSVSNCFGWLNVVSRILTQWMWCNSVAPAIEKVVSHSFCGNVRKQFLAEVADVSGRTSATSAGTSAKEIRVENSLSPCILIPGFELVLVCSILNPLLARLQMLENCSQNIQYLTKAAEWRFNDRQTRLEIECKDVGNSVGRTYLRMQCVSVHPPKSEGLVHATRIIR